MRSQYPSPDKLQMPARSKASPDQQYYVGWVATHNRLWLAFAASFVLNAILITLITLQTARYQPTIKYVTLEGGYPVVWNDRGNVVVHGSELVTPRLRAVVESFIENRYAYDWQNIAKMNTALRLMTPEAATAERQKLVELNPANAILAVRLKTTLKLDYGNFQVVAEGNGRFKVTVSGEAAFLDAFRNTDPNHPFTKAVTVTLVVQQVPATDLNPLGYAVVSTGRDIL